MGHPCLKVETTRVHPRGDMYHLGKSLKRNISPLLYNSNPVDCCILSMNRNNEGARWRALFNTLTTVNKVVISNIWSIKLKPSTLNIYLKR